MKGKIAFVLGAAVGYVLGTRAGRERYEQIKSGAQSLWNTEPVQRGVHLVREAVDERVDELKGFAKRVGADMVSSVARQATGGGSDADAKSKTAAKPKQPDAKATAKSTAKKSTPAAGAADASGDDGKAES